VGEAYSYALYPRHRADSSGSISLQKINQNKNSNLDKSKNNFGLTHFPNGNVLPSLNTDNNFFNKNRINSSINPASRKAGDLINIMPTFGNKTNKDNFFNNKGNNLNKTNNNFHTEFSNKLNKNETFYRKNNNDQNEANGSYLDPIKRFEEFQKTQTNKITEDEIKQNHYFKVEHLRNKEKIRSQEKAFHIKKIKEDEIQNENWLKDIENKINFEKKILEEKNYLANNYKKLVIESINVSEQKGFVEIDKFEKNLSKLGLDINALDPRLKKTGKNIVSSEIVLQKLKEKVLQNEIAKKEKSRRKRKILLDQSKILGEIKRSNSMIKNNESESINENFYNTATYIHPNHNLNLNADSVLAKKIEYEKTRILHDRSLNKELQRKKNEEMYRKETEWQTNIKRNDIKDMATEKNKNIFYDTGEVDSYRNLIKPKDKVFVKEEFLGEVYKEDLDRRQKSLQLKIKKRNRNIPLIKNLTKYLLDFIDDVYNYQTDNNIEQIPLKKWIDYTTMFIQNKPFISNRSITSNYFQDNGEESDNSKNNLNLYNNNLINNYNNNLILEEENDNSILKQSYINDEDFNMFNINENNNIFNNNRKDSSSNFINPIKSAKKRIARDVINEVSFDYINLNSYLPFSKDVFEENELFDYIYFLGKFKDNVLPSNLINKMVDYFEVMKSSGNTQGKKNNAFNMKNNYGIYNKNEANSVNDGIYHDYELKDEDIENLTIPLTNCKNYLLSDIISIILELKFKENNYTTSNNKIVNFNGQRININLNNNNYNNLWDNIPLKICLLGKDFTGKKTQIKFLAENYNMRVYNMDELITKNLEILERLETPLENNPKYKTLKKAEIDKLIAERQLDELKIEPIKNIILSMKDSANSGQGNEDELIIDLLFSYINLDFPDKKDKEKTLEEICIKLKRKREILDEIAKLNEEKNAIQNVISNPTPKEKDIKKRLSHGKDNDLINVLTQELNKLNSESNKGFILINFPKNSNQAKIFEERICGYVSEIDRQKNNFHYLRDNLFLILDKINRPNNIQNKLLCSFDCMFYLDIENEEILRRAKNRKIDPTTGIIYHMDDNPPPPEDKKLNDRLQNLDENFDLEIFQNKINIFDEEIKKIIGFYSPFVNINSKLNLNFKIFNKININEILYEITKANHASNMLNLDSEQYLLTTNENISHNNINMKNNVASQPGKSSKSLAKINKEKEKECKNQINLVKNAIDKILKNTIQINVEKENGIYEKYVLDNQGKDHSNYTNNHQMMSNTSMNSKHINYIMPNNNLSNVSSLKKENLQSHNNNINNANLTNDSYSKGDKTNRITNIISTKEPLISKNNLTNSNNHQNLNNIIDPANSFSNINSSNIENNMFLEEHMQNYNKKYDEAKRKLPSNVIEKIFNSFNNIYEMYTNNLKQIFRNSHKQKESIIANFKKVQEKFIEFLKRHSRKEDYIIKIQSKFNRFIEEYPELKHDEKVRQEFHRDVCEVEDNIWEIIQNRKKDSIEERQKIMECGYIEKEVEKFYKNFIERIFVLETEKFYGGILILRDFYSNIDNKINTEFFTFKPLEILLDQDLEKLPVFNKNIFFQNNDLNNKENVEIIFDSPKVEKLYRNCFKILIKYEEIKKTYEKNLKNQFQYNSNISSDSLPLRRANKSIRRVPNNNQDSIFSDEKRDLIFFEEELRLAIKQEKNKYKYRITFLKYWSLNFLKKIRDLCKTIYDKLDEWIINTIKMENDAMNSVTHYFDECIEKAVKMRFDRELDSFDIYRQIDSSENFEISVKNYYEIYIY